MSMTPFKNIALWGVGGDNIGSHILSVLLKDPSFNVTIIARSSSKSPYPSNVPIIRVDDSLSHSSLVSALQGQDVLISTVGSAGLSSQLQIAQAAIEAGVRRFVPSEFGFDNGDSRSHKLSPYMFKSKGELSYKLDELAKENAEFSWTAVANSIWLDWALDVKFLNINAEAHSVVFWDEGTHAPSMTTLPYAAQGVLQVLKHPQLFNNQRVFLEAFPASQGEIVAELEKQQGVKYSSTTISGAETVKKAEKTLAEGFDANTQITATMAAIWVPEFKADFVSSGKQPILEHFAHMPKITLEDVVREYIARH